MNGGSNRTLKALFVLALLLLAAEAGRVPLFEPDEGRYAEIPREMLATGDFVTPRLNGVLYFEKPPLHYWSVAASETLFGKSELATRLPTRLASVGLALLAYLFARPRWGERTALLAGLIAASSILVVALARINHIDPSLSFALSGAVFAFAAFQEAEAKGDARRARRALYGLHACCAAAVMLKGLIGIVLPGGAIVAWILVTGRFRILPRLFSPGPLLLFLALAVPWHVLVARRNPSFLQFYFVHEHFDRFAATEHRRGGSPLYFVAVILGGLLPWTGFFGRYAGSWPGRSLAAWRERPTEGFLWIFSILVFLFFSASRSKLIPYIEPVWPALSVLLALGIERAREGGASFRLDRILTAVFLGALLVAGAVYAFGAGYAERFGAAGPAVVLIAGLAAGFLAALWPRRRPDAEPALSIAAPWLVFLLGAVLALPAVARSITPWSLAKETVAELGPDDVFLQRGHYLQVVTYYTGRITPIGALGWSELNFGQGQPHVPGLFPSDEEFASLWNGPRRALAVVHRDRLGDFARPPIGLAPPRLLASERNGKHHLLANR